MCAKKNIAFLVPIVLVLLIAMGNNPNAILDDNSEILTESVIIEGVREFSLAAVTSEYPDYSYLPSYGYHDNEPSFGMGQDSGGSVGDRTNLTEETVYFDQWTTKMSRSSFSSLPSGWSSLEIGYSGGYFQESGITGWYGGYMICSTVDTQNSNMVRFSLDLGGNWGTDEVTIQFWDGSNWDTMLPKCSTGSITTQTWTSSDPQYQIPNFRVQLVFGLFDGDLGTQNFQANEWLIQAQYEREYQAFQAVYRFDSVDFSGYSIEELHVDYTEGFSSTESLAFRFAEGDDTPNNIVEGGSDGQTDFSVDIHSLVTGDTCYVDIRDTVRTTSDTIVSSWFIDRLYILLNEPDPVWDDIPFDKVIEYAQPLSYQMNATLLPATDTWWLNDTTNFAIDGNGLITNALVLPVGTYGVEVSVNDTWDRTISDEFMLTVQDTVKPSWATPITSQEEEYNVDFEYILGATDAAGIKSWGLNDSVNFQMDNGVITNNTPLEVGYYGLNVTVIDNNDNSLSEIFSVFINDTVDPEWVSTPLNQFREYGLDFVYDLNATDASGISWHINDTDFSIDAEGVIRNVTSLTVQIYGLLVTAEDGHGNTISESFKLFVNDTTNPVWIQDPANQFREFGAPFRYNLNASDLAGIATWLIDDMMNFTIDGNGIVSNITTINVGNYSLHVTAIDNHGLSLDGYFILEVEDTTPPNFITVPVQDLEYGEQLSLQLVASDLSGIAQWQINNTANFTISNTGFLTSLDNLDSGWYFVEVTVIDGHGLSSSLVVSVFVALSPPTTTTTTPPPDNSLLLMLAIGSIVIGVIVLVASLRTSRAVRKHRLKQLQTSEGDVDTALDYLDFIKPTLENEDEET